MTNVNFGNCLISFGFSPKDELKKLLRENSEKDVFLDLSCFDPAEFYLAYPNLKGSFSALFCDEAKKIEVHLREKNEQFLSKLRQLGFIPVETTIVSCGFIFPRTIVQIINEAHFALEEAVASREDIDRAMKYGVNYPKGPFEWAKGRELFVLTLLNELYQKTQDNRYQPSKLLTV